MSQSPHPHDPYGTEPGIGAPDGQQPVDSRSVAPQDGPLGDPAQGSPTSDPALHPHDPYAYDARAQAPGASADPASSANAAGPDHTSALSPYGSPSPAPTSGQDPWAAPSSSPGQDPFAAPAAGAGQSAPTGASQNPAGAPGAGSAQGQHAAQDQYGPHGQPGAQGPYGNQGPYGDPGQHGGAGQHPGAGQQYAQQGPANLDVPPPGIKGAFDGPLTGTPLQDADAKTWALVVHLAALLQFVIPFIGGLIAQVVLYVIFKDRNRFVRYNAAEALNGTIAALILSFALGALFTIITIVTFGIGAFLFGLLFIPTVVQAIFAIIGSVKAYQGEWWNYPANIRLVK